MKKTNIIILISILILEALATGIIPISRGHLFDGLTAHSNMIWVLLGLYFLNYIFIEGAQSVKAYVVRKVSLLYRESRTLDVVKVATNNVTNAPQRIQEDIKLSYHNRISVWAEYFVSGIILVQLVIMNLGQPILVGAAILYSLVSIFIATRFNPRLTAAEIDVQAAEADFRGDLTHSFMNFHRLPMVNFVVLKAERTRMFYYLFTRLQGTILTVLPYIVLIPALFANQITLGLLMQHSASFSLIVVNATILISLYTTLIQGSASELRVKELEDNQ